MFKQYPNGSAAVRPACLGRSRGSIGFDATAVCCPKLALTDADNVIAPQAVVSRFSQSRRVEPVRMALSLIRNALHELVDFCVGKILPRRLQHLAELLLAVKPAGKADIA